MKNVKRSVCFLVVALLTLFVLPFNVFASENDGTVAETLQEACKSEGIEFNDDNFQNSSDKATIYLFRGAGCAHCHEFLTYLSQLAGKMGDKFNVVSFEVWNNKNNSDLMTKVSETFNDDASGVPYFVIGEKTFKGYESGMNTEIEKAITDLAASDNQYDVMAYLDQQGYFDGTAKKTSNDVAAFVIMEIINIVVFGVIIVNNMRNYKEKIAKLNEEIKTLKEEKTTKKENNKKNE